MCNRESVRLGVFVVLIGQCAGSCDVLDVDCLSDVKISVRLDSPVEFDWEPGCEATALWVTHTGTGNFHWAIEGEFKPPVAFGEKPRASNTLRRAISLASDSEYRVELIGGTLYGVGKMGEHRFKAP